MQEKLSEAEQKQYNAYLIEIQRRNASRDLHDFCRQAWPIVEPDVPFVDGWHIGAMCEHLENVSRGTIRNLLINVPPRNMKSTIVSIMWPAWTWTYLPSMKWLFSSHAESLVKRDSIKMRRLIESEWYRGRFGIRWNLSPDQNEKIRYDNTAGGSRIGTSVGGSVIGEGGDIIVCDDPHELLEVKSETVRKRVHEWWDQAMSTRTNDPKTARKVIIMQRLHQDDLAGHVLEKGGWEHLCLPAEYEGDKKATSIGWTDPRSEVGELLWPERFGQKEIEQLKTDLGSQGWAGQGQQRPSPASGVVVKREWWRFYKELPSDVRHFIQSWDLSFDATDVSSFVVGQVWGRRGADRFLIDQYRARVRYTGQKMAVRTMSGKHPQAGRKLVEKKANGAALIDDLRSSVPGLIPVEPHGSKLIRAESVSPQIESGNVYLPDPSIAPWIHDFIEEWNFFPNGKNDDQVDASSQALDDMARKRASDDINIISVTKASIWNKTDGLHSSL